MEVPNLFRLLVAAACVAAVVSACSGNDGSAGASGGADGVVRVVATTTPVGAVAREVGGDAIELTVLLQPGVEAHDYELTPAAGAALEQADVILVSGAGLESWLEDALTTIGGADRIRDLSDGITLRAPMEEQPADEHAAAGEVDPHYWLDAANAIVMVENARDALVAAAPTPAEEFDARAGTLVARLEAADGEIRRLMGEVPAERRGIVTDHDALGYFIAAYGLEFVGSLFPSLDVSSEPSAQEIERLVAEIRAHDVRAIFTESAVNPQLARAVAEETDARLVDEPLYTDSVGPEGSGAETLDGMLLHNARVIHDGLTGG